MEEIVTLAKDSLCLFLEILLLVEIDLSLLVVGGVIVMLLRRKFLGGFIFLILVDLFLSLGGIVAARLLCEFLCELFCVS